MNVSATTGSKIIIALDYAQAQAAMALVERLDPARCNLKVGKELFVRGGPDLVRTLVGKGYRVFLDLKFHDIPNTVARACEAAADLGVWMVNVHALGGRRMLSAAREALGDAPDRPRLVAVTVLTSMGAEDLREVGLPGEPIGAVSHLARLTAEAGLDGVVCSAQEAVLLRRERGDDFLLVTPGIRPAWSAKGDQTRITTPAQALRDGASYLVIGRPITGAPDPLEALDRIAAEIRDG